MSAEIDTQTGNSTKAFLVPHDYSGRLMVAEGLDGSGKSTQLRLLQFWLQAEGYDVITTELIPSKLTRRALKLAKKQGGIKPRLLSVLNAADFAELHEREIVPGLQRGAIVLADRYVYSTLARDLARGVEHDWIEGVYSFASRPDLSIYFQLSAAQSVERTLSHHPRLKYYQAAMDLGLSHDPIASFHTFQQQVLQEYESMINPYHLLCIDATLPVKQQQRFLRDAVERMLPDEL